MNIAGIEEYPDLVGKCQQKNKQNNCFFFRYATNKANDRSVGVVKFYFCIFALVLIRDPATDLRKKGDFHKQNKIQQQLSMFFFLESSTDSSDEKSRKRKKDLKLTSLGIVLAIAKGRDLIREMRRMLN